MGTVTVTVSVTYPYAFLSGGMWERAPLYSAWGLARSTGGGLCEASHCYMMPEGGYQSNGSQDTQEQEGGLDSDPGTNAHLQELVKVGRAEIREVKTDIRSSYCYNCANWHKLRSKGYEDVIKQYNDLCVGEIAARLLHCKLLQATCSQSCMFCFLSFFNCRVYYVIMCQKENKPILLAVKASFHFPWQDLLMKATISKCPVRYSILIKCLMLHLYRSE